MRSSNNKRPWWVIVGNSPWLWVFLAVLPAVLLYANRFLIPDYATDSLSYHLFNGQRASHNLLLGFMPSELYPVSIGTLAAGYDLMNYIVRLVLGYRLGTILDLLAAIGCTIILYRLMLLILKEWGRKFHAGWGLLLVNASIVLELYFQLATYLVDILNAFCVLLVFYWVATSITKRRKQPLRLWMWIAQWIALGALVELKLTNTAFVLPLAGLLLWDLYRHREALSAKRWSIYLVTAMCLFLPLLPSWTANYHVSHNPLFPYYNGIFKSAYYPPTSYRDSTFGAKTPLQQLLWPGASTFSQTQLGEPHQIYNDYKLVLYWLCGLLLASLALLKRLKLGKLQSVLVYYVLSSMFVWGFLFGINRYLISTMLLGGLLLVMVCAASSSWKQRGVRIFWTGLSILLCGAMFIDSYRIIHFNMHYDISWRPPLYQNLALHRSQLPVLFTRHLALSASERTTLNNADITLNCNNDVAALLLLLPSTTSKPVVNVTSDDLPQYAALSNDRAYQQEALRRLQTIYPHKSVFNWVSVTSDSGIGPTAAGCLQSITARGVTITATQPINSFMGFSGFSFNLISGQIRL